MWVFQENVDGKNLTDIINTEHENVKYLPVRPPARCPLPAPHPDAVGCRRQGVKFTDNVIADPDLTNAVQGATLLIFVLPHQVTRTPRLSRPPDPVQPRPTCAAAPASIC